MTQNGHSKPTFETLADETLDRVRGIYQQRGTEYADTWKNPQMLKMRATAMKLGINLPDEHCKVMALAALADVKYSRFAGGYKEDNVDDGIAYDAAWAAEMRRVLSVRPVEPAISLNGNGHDDLAIYKGLQELEEKAKTRARMNGNEFKPVGLTAEEFRLTYLAGQSRQPEPAPATPSV